MVDHPISFSPHQIHQAIRAQTQKELKRTEERVTSLKNYLQTQSPSLSNGAKLGIRAVSMVFLKFLSHSSNSDPEVSLFFL
jgi:hypothetical protein